MANSVNNEPQKELPISKEPQVYSVTKGTAKKSGIVFVIAFMIAVFVTFLLLTSYF